ncbi:MAG: hypothetical protein K2M87_01405 [Muribaculaceae bacterium]|nr:hypothetical protein [Muribaculaceae bacterium]
MNDIQKCWNETKFHNFESGASKKRQTALQSLADRYRRFSRMALIFAILSPCWMFGLLRHSLNTTDISAYLFQAYMVLYFLLAFFMDKWLAKGISKINVAEISVAEVCRLAYYYRKKHFQFIAILLPLAIILIVWLAMLLSTEKYLIYGVVTGALVGIAIGAYKLSQFLEEYRDIISD